MWPYLRVENCCKVNSCIARRLYSIIPLMKENSSFYFGELSPWNNPTTPMEQQCHPRRDGNPCPERMSHNKGKSISTKGSNPRKKPEERPVLKPLMPSVISLPRLVNRQRHDLQQLLQQTSSQMRSSKISNSSLLESHLRHKRKLSKGMPV